MRLALIAMALFGIAFASHGIRRELHAIRIEFVTARCLAEAREGITCPEVEARR